MLSSNLLPINPHHPKPHRIIHPESTFIADLYQLRMACHSKRAFDGLDSALSPVGVLDGNQLFYTSPLLLRPLEIPCPKRYRKWDAANWRFSAIDAPILGLQIVQQHVGQTVIVVAEIFLCVHSRRRIAIERSGKGGEHQKSHLFRPLRIR